MACMARKEDQVKCSGFQFQCLLRSWFSPMCIRVMLQHTTLAWPVSATLCIPCQCACRVSSFLGYIKSARQAERERETKDTFRPIKCEGTERRDKQYSTYAKVRGYKSYSQQTARERKKSGMDEAGEGDLLIALNEAASELLTNQPEKTTTTTWQRKQKYVTAAAASISLHCE